MTKIIISLSGTGELFDVLPVTPVLSKDYNPDIDIRPTWTTYLGVPQEVCLLRDGIFCSTSEGDIINPKVISIQELIETLPPLPPSGVKINHQGTGFINQQFILELTKSSEVFDPDKVTLVQTDFNRLYGNGIISSRLLYDGKPIPTLRWHYIQPLHLDFHPITLSMFSEPIARYFFNQWNTD